MAVARPLGLALATASANVLTDDVCLAMREAVSSASWSTLASRDQNPATTVSVKGSTMGLT